MGILLKEGGAALVTALLLTALSLVIALALLYSVTAGTRVSAGQRRYRSALSAAHGGVELLTREIIPRLFQEQQSALLSDFVKINLQLPQLTRHEGCLQQKLNAPTASWTGYCAATQFSANPAEAPDMTFKLSGVTAAADFTISTKIIDTVPGNSDKGGLDDLDPGESVAGGGAGAV